jgi:pyrroline-5-carboxylate reductase
MKIGFIGTGHITKSVINGILGYKLKIKKILVSKRSQKISSALKRKSKNGISLILSKNIIKSCWKISF